MFGAFELGIEFFEGLVAIDGAIVDRAAQEPCRECHSECGDIVMTEREPVRQILAHLGLPPEAPPVARARDPTDDAEDAEPSDQLELQLCATSSAQSRGFPKRRENSENTRRMGP